MPRLCSRVEQAARDSIRELVLPVIEEFGHLEGELNLFLAEFPMGVQAGTSVSTNPTGGRYAATMRVLVVEDDRTEALMVTGLLENTVEAEFAVTVAESLEAALDQIRRGSVDVVLLDLNLADSQGLDTFVAVRNREPDLPVVVVTAAGDTDLGRQAVESGASDFVPKGRLNKQGLGDRSLFAVGRRRASNQALQDPLTGLATLALYIDRLEAALSRTEVERRLLAVLWIGLDNFTVLAETLGAPVDGCLVESAARIRGGLRPPDTLARVGSSDFGAVVEGIARPSNAERAAHRVLGAFVEPVPSGPTTTPVTVSIGIAVGRFPETADTLIDRARQAARGGPVLRGRWGQAGRARRLTQRHRSACAPRAGDTVVTFARQ